jgi:glycosyltransferase involved in cell wall biosynthesis
MLIAFVHNGKTFVPAFDGYLNFFSKFDVDVVGCTAKELKNVNADVEWHFMGLDQAPKTNVVKIHDYMSASTPPFATLKNKLKAQLNTKPDFRLFLNQYIHDCFSFDDNIPFGFRDMGVQNFFSEPVPGRKEFDFIYVGEMRSRQLHKVIRCFTTGVLSTKTILFVSKDYDQLKSSLKPYPNIKFIGPVDRNEVQKYISSAKFAINYIPNIEPYNKQTSTKFLEYAACRIPVISSRYEWVDGFEQKYGGRYFYLNDDFSNFTWQAVNEFEYRFPDLTDWTWDSQIKKSGVLSYLSSRFSGTRW